MEAPKEPTASIARQPPSGSNGDTGSSKDPQKIIRRACDCCRKRKVKCDGFEPCGPCKKASIRCAYLQPPKKKGPKGLRSARVLHALRRIDDTVTNSPTSPLSPDQSGGFGGWQWGSSNGLNVYQGQITPRQNGQYGPQSSMSPEQSYYQARHQQVPLSVAAQSESGWEAYQQLQSQHRPTTYRHDANTHQGWSSNSESVTSDIPPIMSPTGVSELPQARLAAESFLPYIRLFFDHMFPIMPIIDRNAYLDPMFYRNSNVWTSDVYSFLCAISAATTVQLDESIQKPPPLHPIKPTDDLFAEECLRERLNFDYVEIISPTSVMTSFFLFAYYGNHEKHVKAWHYLQESITFAENLDLDNEDRYAKLDPVQAQWHRRLYWLLFITERAYAVQRRKCTRLHASVHLPAVLESEDPQLLNGFVNLANLFSAVDDSFVSAWRGSRRASLCNEAWLMATQKQLDAAALALDDVSETQNVDISVTREWLHVLAWQMGVSNGLMGRGEGTGGMSLDYPIELARKVVAITTGAHAPALDAHGIGMEQKLSDIAGCLADVLKCTAGDTSPTFLQGKEYLSILLQQLSNMRGKESRYLKPLMSKLDSLLGYELSNQTLPLPTDSVVATSDDGGYAYLGADMRQSMADSMGMLRTLSMSGMLGMPGMNVPVATREDWQQRRASGRVFEEGEGRDVGGQDPGW